jgi:hypothetical protein
VVLRADPKQNLSFAVVGISSRLSVEESAGRIDYHGVGFILFVNYLLPTYAVCATKLSIGFEGIERYFIENDVY